LSNAITPIKNFKTLHCDGRAIFFWWKVSAAGTTFPDLFQVKNYHAVIGRTATKMEEFPFGLLGRTFLLPNVVLYFKTLKKEKRIGTSCQQNRLLSKINPTQIFFKFSFLKLWCGAFCCWYN
jgi:hypothetical protein